MKEYFFRYSFPGVIALVGLLLISVGLKLEQNTLFNVAGFAILCVGIISILGAAQMISKVVKNVLVGVLLISAVSLGAANYKSIKDPIVFDEAKTARMEVIVQRLKDVRAAELSFKNRYGGFAPTFDSLLNFVHYDSLIIIKAEGNCPDTLTEAEAVELNIIQRDTIMVPVNQALFNEAYLGERMATFVVDSLRYIPFSGGEEFELDAGTIESGSVDVPVFECKAVYAKFLGDLDSRFYKKKDMVRVGDMWNPSTNGNWE